MRGLLNTTRHRLLSPAALLVAAMLLLAACGGDDDDQPPVTPIASPDEEPEQLTRAEFTRRADSICVEANTAIVSLAAGEAGTSTESLLDQRRLITEGAIDQIEALGTPQGPTDDLDSFLSSSRELISALERQVDALSAGDEAAAQTAAESVSSAESQAAEAAFDYGLEACAQDDAAVAGGEEGFGEPLPGEPVEPAAPEQAPVPEPAPAPDAGGTTPEPEPAPQPAPGNGGGSGGLTP